MDLDRLEQRARSTQTRKELEQLLKNVQERGSQEQICLVVEVLKDRFPIDARSGGATPTEVAFRGRSERLDTGKEAYIWLVEQFLAFDPEILTKYSECAARHTRGVGRKFAKTSMELYPPDSTRASTSSNYAALSGSWFADVNMDHRDKFLTLLTLARLSGLAYPTDFEFRPLGSTKELRMHQDAVVRAREALDKLFNGKTSSAG